LVSHRLVFAALFLAASTSCAASPKVVIISLDGAKPDLVEQYLKSGPRAGPDRP
jgi:hypothetical protein